MSTAKWFTNLTAATSAIDAARVVLEARAHTVLHYLTIVTRTQAGEPEDIHQLRVATRRLAAALSIFKDYLRSSDYRRVRRISRHVRRAAGAARDLDVHRDLIATRLGAAGPRGTHLAMACECAFERQRRLVTQRLLRVARVAVHDFSEAIGRSLTRLKHGAYDRATAAEVLGPMARKNLRRRLKELRAAGRDDLDDLDCLHQLRIAAKRLRYSMEVFAGCLPASVRGNHYRVVERLQEELGLINDLRTVVATIDDLCSGLHAKVPAQAGRATAMTAEQFQARLKAELKMRKSRFVARWGEEAQRRFHRRLKKLLNGPATKSRIHGPRIT